jgi:peptidoglycan/LPS O-acetylase OafA/YrhL
MGEIEKIKKIIGIIWLVILVFLWMFYPMFPGDIFFWMWLAIIWSIIGGVMGIILFMGESKKNEIIVGIIWAVILVILWIFYPLIPGDKLPWTWVVIVWMIIGGIMDIGLWIFKRKK